MADDALPLSHLGLRRSHASQVHGSSLPMLCPRQNLQRTNTQRRTARPMRRAPGSCLGRQACVVPCFPARQMRPAGINPAALAARRSPSYPSFARCGGRDSESPQATNSGYTRTPAPTDKIISQPPTGRIRLIHQRTRKQEDSGEPAPPLPRGPCRTSQAPRRSLTVPRRTHDASRSADSNFTVFFKLSSHPPRL